MSRMTAEDIVNTTRRTLGNPDTDTLSDTDILRYLNQVYYRLSGRFDHPELRSITTVATVSGTAEYELSATDIASFLDAVDTTNTSPIVMISQDMYYQWDSGVGTTGTPTHFFVSGSSSNALKVTFYPKPDSVCTIVFPYIKRPAELVLSPTPTSPILNEAWDEALLSATVAKSAKAIGDYERATTFMAEYTSLVNEIFPGTIHSPNVDYPIWG